MLAGGKSCAPSASGYVSVGNLLQRFDLQQTVKDDGSLIWLCADLSLLLLL